MDGATRREWGKRINSEGGVVNFEVYKTFLQESIKTLKKLESNRTSHREEMTGRRKAPGGHRSEPVKSFTIGRLECRLCHQPHPLRRCNEFESMSITQRRSFVARARLCYNCLQSGHNAQHCISEQRCRKCDRQHHTLLHHPEIGKRASETSPERTSAGKRPRLGDESNASHGTSA